MITGLTKKEKITEIHYNAAEPFAEIYTHDTKLKKRLLVYAEAHPKLCQLIQTDKQGGMRFQIDKNRMSIRLTAPYSEERKLCKQVGDDKKGGLRFTIDKSRMSIRLTAPYSEERRAAVGVMGKEYYKNLNQAKEER